MAKSDAKTIAAIIIAIVVIAGGFLLLAPSAKAETAKIGFIGPLTGDAAVYGLPLQNVVQLAADEINAAGGVNGRILEIIYEDGKCNGADAATAMRKLVSIDRVEVVLGGFCSSESLGGGAYSHGEQGVPVLARLEQP